MTQKQSKDDFMQVRIPSDLKMRARRMARKAGFKDLTAFVLDSLEKRCDELSIWSVTDGDKSYVSTSVMTNVMTPLDWPALSMEQES